MPERRHAKPGDRGPELSSWAKWDPDTKRGQEPVTVGTPIGFMVRWNGWCKFTNDPMREQSGRNNDYPCKFVDNEVTVECANACTLEPNGDGHRDAWNLVPTKPGELRATVTVKRKRGGVSKQFVLEPVTILDKPPAPPSN